MFGFQRVGDMIWSCGDMMCRGFLFGGTAGRTTLNGEGLQHQDGHSQLIAATVPCLKSYDPAFAYELAVIVRDGIFRMYELQEDVFYYLTVYNENYAMPALPENISVDGILKGLYCFRKAPQPVHADQLNVHLLACGAIVQQALAAVLLLEEAGCAVNVWSMTSPNELYRDAIACERWNRLHPHESPRQSYLEQQLGAESGVFVAVSDYQKLLGNQLAKWIDAPFTALGTDGFGLSESRRDLRRHFEIGPEDIAAAALDLGRRSGQIGARDVRKAHA